MLELRIRVKSALEEIVRHRDSKALIWTVNYAKHALTMLDAGCSDADLKIQMLYVLGNITQ